MSTHPTGPDGQGGDGQDRAGQDRAGQDRDGSVPNPETGVGIGAGEPSTFEPEEDAGGDEGTST